MATPVAGAQLDPSLPIAMFDSGVGGLTVLHECLVSLPEEDYVYLGDTAWFPYGTKDPDQLRARIRSIAELLLGGGAKLLVIACNTATAIGEAVAREVAGELPASNEKLTVTYAALTALGPGFTIETDVLGEGQQVGTTWQGDLVLKGYGDPTLSSADLTALARQVRASGIRTVSGRILGDESWFDAHRTALGWKAAFYINESPPLSALIVDRGRVGRYTSRDPALAAAQLFRAALVRVGVQVGGGAAHGTADDAGIPLAEVDSPTLAAIVRWMDKVSDNFVAEMLVKELGAVQSGAGTTAAGLGVVAGQLQAAGVPLAGVRLVDGSGLSLLDRLTPAALVSLLSAMWRDPEVRLELLASLPVAGRTGTLHDRMRTGPATGVVRAKTGTTDNASALSGFVADRYVFSILQNGYPVSWAWARVAQDRFAAALAAAQ